MFVNDPVKRKYDSRNRDAQSQATRQRIVDAAHELIVERGYRAATVSAIAAEAEVHVDTIYQLLGRKTEVLRELIERAVSGEDRPVPVDQRAYVAEITAEPDPSKKIDLYAAITRQMLARVAPLYVALRDAAGTDANAKQLWSDFSERRATNMRGFVADIAQAGGLRDGLSIEDAADTVWATNSPELYIMLTRERQWTAEQYERWLADAWRRLLHPIELLDR